MLVQRARATLGDSISQLLEPQRNRQHLPTLFEIGHPLRLGARLLGTAAPIGRIVQFVVLFVHPEEVVAG